MQGGESFDEKWHLSCSSNAASRNGRLNYLLISLHIVDDRF